MEEYQDQSQRTTEKSAENLEDGTERDPITEQTKEEEQTLGIFSLSKQEYVFLTGMGALGKISEGETVKQINIERHLALVRKALDDLPLQSEDEAAWITTLPDDWDALSGEEKLRLFKERFSLGSNERAVRPGLVLSIHPWYKPLDKDEELEIMFSKKHVWIQSGANLKTAVENMRDTIIALCDRVIESEDSEFIIYKEGEFETKEHEVLHKVLAQNPEKRNEFIANVIDLYHKNDEAQQILSQVYRFHEYIKDEEFLVNTYMANRHAHEQTSYGWNADQIEEELIEEMHNMIIDYLSSGGKSK